MKLVKLLVGTILVGILVALVYHFFESLVHNAIDLVWNDWFNTGTTRWLVVPICIISTLIYFGIQHMLDPSSESHEAHGLGQAPNPTLSNLAKVLFIGFLSLLAGASLGPEAILVPACMVVGGLVGKQLFHENKATKLLTMAGFIALFAAFFHSFIAGMLGLLLVKKQTKLQLNPLIVGIAVIASATTYFTLKLFNSKAYFDLPPYSWKISFGGLVALILLVLGGYVAITFLSVFHRVFLVGKEKIENQSWLIRAIVAGTGLSVLYLLGGSLVEFTGNKSIVPMFEQAASLGFMGLMWILVVKLAAMSWSKTMGYRGGMIFPTIFVASVLVAMSEIVFHDVNLIYGLLAVLVGAFAADKRVKILL